MYYILDLRTNVSIPADNWRAAARQFDQLTDRGRDAVLYHVKNGEMHIVERVIHHTNNIGAMR